MNKKGILILCTIIIILTVAIWVTLFIINRNRIDYYIPLPNNNSGEETHDSGEYDDYTYNYEKDIDPWWDLTEEERQEEMSKVDKEYTGKLKEAQEIYNKVNLGDKREVVITKAGDPSKIEKEDTNSYEWISYNAPSGEYNVIIALENGEVCTKNLYLNTGYFTQVYLSKELDTDIETLDDAMIEKIHDGMTLEEVVKVLGNKYYEYGQDKDQGTIYVWCDKAEHEFALPFMNGVSQSFDDYDYDDEADILYDYEDEHYYTE